MTTSDRVCAELSSRLKKLLPDEIVDRFVGESHTQRLEDNLAPGLSLVQLRTLRNQLLHGSGGELTPTRTGKRPAHAPYSSAAFTLNLFGRWLGDEPKLHVAGLSGFNTPLRIEHKLKIAHNGGTANLDCFLEGPQHLMGIEIKLTETLREHAPVLWKAPYRSEDMSALLTDKWRELLRASVSGEWKPRYLGVEQLIKHALALRSHRDAREQYLVYCFWTPENAVTPQEVVRHREEAAKLLHLVGDTPPRLRVIEYARLIEEWAELPAPDWILEHVSYLRQRYSFSL